MVCNLPSTGSADRQTSPTPTVQYAFANIATSDAGCPVMRQGPTFAGWSNGKHLSVADVSSLTRVSSTSLPAAWQRVNTVVHRSIMPAAPLTYRALVDLSCAPCHGACQQLLVRASRNRFEAQLTANKKGVESKWGSRGGRGGADLPKGLVPTCRQ